MDLEASLWLLSVIRNGSFSKAAQDLKVPVSTLSRRIAQLEKQCHAQLIVRNTRSLKLTTTGLEFVSIAKELEEKVNKLKSWRDSQAGVCGVLRITAPIQFIEWPLSDWVVEFKLLYPALQIEMIGSNEYLDFYEHHIDIGFRQGPLPDSLMKQRRLFSLQYGIFAPVSWPIRDKTEQSLTWLEQQRAINIGAKGRAFPWLIKDQKGLVRFYPNAELLLESPQQVIKAAKAGAGIAYASYFDAHRAVIDKKIKPICLDLWPGWIDFFVVYQQTSLKSQKLATFIDFIFSKQEELKLLEGVKTS